MAKWMFALERGSGAERSCDAKLRTAYEAEPDDALLADVLLAEMASSARALLPLPAERERLARMGREQALIRSSRAPDARSAPLAIPGDL